MIGLWITKDSVVYGDINMFGVAMRVKITNSLPVAIRDALHLVFLDNCRLPLWPDFPQDFADLDSFVAAAVAALPDTASQAEPQAPWAISLLPQGEAVLWRVWQEQPTNPLNIVKEGYSDSLPAALQAANKYIRKEE